MKIVTIVGARPQFIKCAPLSREIRKNNTEILVHTGQHYDRNMSAVFFEELRIPAPDYNLSIGSGPQGEQTGRMLGAIEEVLIKEEPDLLLVYGDTNSTIAGALAAAKLHIPVAHVEAGLRSFDRRMPEETNRVVTDHVSALLFCPTETAVVNLREEGITEGVYMTGDVMVDAVLFNRELAAGLNSAYPEGGYYCATVHRAGNTDSEENLRNIISALSDLDLPVIFPAHPRTLKCMQEYGLKAGGNVRIIEPLPYLEMLDLMAHSKKILTDSGGIQKEAHILGVPCVTLRENTEWVETLDGGWNVLAGAERERILEAAKGPAPEASGHCQLFGGGRASERIVEWLEVFAGGRP